MLLLMALGAFALVDVPLQRFLWLKQLRMSHQEVKQEHKETEGNSEVKARMRQRMREVANRRMLAEVPKFKMITVSILSDRLRINCSLARRVLVLLTVRAARERRG